MTGRRITEGRRSVSGDVGEEKRIRRRRRKTSTACPMTKMGTRRVDEELGGPEEDVLMMMGGEKEGSRQKQKHSTATIHYQEETAWLHSICLKNGDSVNINCVRDISPDMKRTN